MNLSAASVKGYRSSISSTLKHVSSVDFSSDPVLADIRIMEMEKTNCQLGSSSLGPFPCTGLSQGVAF